MVLAYAKGNFVCVCVCVCEREREREKGDIEIYGMYEQTPVHYKLKIKIRKVINQKALDTI